MEAYGGVNQLSETIAQRVCKDLENEPKNVTVVIFDQSSFLNVLAWQSFIASATALKGAYETLLTEGEVKALFPPPPPEKEKKMLAFIPVTSASDLAGLITALASSTTNNASTFTIQDSTMAVSLAHQFQRITCKADLQYFPLFGSYVDVTESNKLVQAPLDDLNKLRKQIQRSESFPKKSDDPKFILFNDLNNQYDLLLKSITSNLSQGQGGQQQGSPSAPGIGAQQAGVATGSQSSGASPTSLAQGAVLNSLLAQDNTYILYADVVAAGGTQRDRKNIFTLITGDWISYSGGLIVNVAFIHSKDRKLQFADTLRYRTGYARHISNPRESNDIENTNAGENEDSMCGKEKRLHWWQGRKYLPNPCASAK
jgi:hypothetical protein